MKNSNKLTSIYGGKHPKVKKKKNSMKSTQLIKVFKNLLKNFYWVEKALKKVNTQMIKKASSKELIQSINLAGAESDPIRVEEIFNSVDKYNISKNSNDIKKLIYQAEQITELSNSNKNSDSGILMILQEFHKYKIASYEGLCSISETLGEEETTAMLNQSLNDEKIINERISQIAESVNFKIAIGDNRA